MPALRRALAAATVAGVLLVAGCTGGPGTPDDPTTGPSATTTSPATAQPSEPDPTDQPTAPVTPTSPPQTEPTQAPGDGRATVTPFISYAGPGTDPSTIEVAGFVPQVIEEGGTCTATIPATGVSVQAPAYADATSTSCGLLVLPVAPAGQTVVLTYSSDASTGVSDPVQVTS